MREEKYNNDELVPPSFVGRSLILDMLKSLESDAELSLEHYEIMPGSCAGDHFASIMFRIIANYETRGRKVEKRRFILKTVPESGAKRDFLDKIPVFKNEIKMYKKTLPAMEKILIEAGLSPFWPKLVFATDQPPILIFDDLTQEAFEMVRRPLSFNQLQLVTANLAKFHALSMTVAESNQNDLVAGFSDTFSVDFLRPMFGCLVDQIKHLGTISKEWQEFRDIGAKLESNFDMIFENFAMFYSAPIRTDLNVLNHGDFTLRNLMFQRDSNGELYNAIFLDFQGPKYHSPAFDLLSCLNTIGDRQARQRRSDIIKSYHNELVNFLVLFKYSGNIPTLKMVNEHISRMIAYDAFYALAMMPNFEMDLSGTDLSELLNEEKNPFLYGLQKLSKDPYFVEEMKGLLSYFDSFGVFDKA